MLKDLTNLKPALKELVAELRKSFAYASVLAVEERYRSWRVGRSGISIGSTGTRGCGFCIRVFDDLGAAEYSINIFSREMVRGIAAVMNERESIMSAFAAAWIVLISGDDEIIAKAVPDILEALDRVPFDDLYYAPFFFAENVISRMVAVSGEKGPEKKRKEFPCA